MTFPIGPRPVATQQPQLTVPDQTHRQRCMPRSHSRCPRSANMTAMSVCTESSSGRQAGAIGERYQNSTRCLVAEIQSFSRRHYWPPQQTVISRSCE